MIRQNVDLSPKTEKAVFCALDPAEDPAVRIRRFHNAMARTKSRGDSASFVVILPPEIKTVARVQGDLRKLNIAEDPAGVVERTLARVLSEERRPRPWLVVDGRGARASEE